MRINTWCPYCYDEDLTLVSQETRSGVIKCSQGHEFEMNLFAQWIKFCLKCGRYINPESLCCGG